MKINKRLAFPLAVCMLLIWANGVRAQDSAPTYIVESGDTLTQIARVFGTTVEALSSLNQIADPSTLYVGQELVLPGLDLSGRLTISPLPFGTDLGLLAYRMETPPEALYAANHVVNPERMYAEMPILHPYMEQLPLASNFEWSRFQREDARLLQAARLGSNPWALSSERGGVFRSYLLPGDRLMQHGAPLVDGFQPLLSLELT